MYFSLLQIETDQSENDTVESFSHHMMEALVLSSVQLTFIQKLPS